jgi:hypothetical protein
MRWIITTARNSPAVVASGLRPDVEPRLPARRKKPQALPNRIGQSGDKRILRGYFRAAGCRPPRQARMPATTFRPLASAVVVSGLWPDVEPRLPARRKNLTPSRTASDNPVTNEFCAVISGRQDAVLHGRQGCLPLRLRPLASAVVASGLWPDVEPRLPARRKNLTPPPNRIGQSGDKRPLRSFYRAAGCHPPRQARMPATTVPASGVCRSSVRPLA